MPNENLTLFRRDGFLGPVRLFTLSQCALIMRYLRHGDLPPEPDWYKSRITVDRFLYELATRPHLMAHLRPLLGDNIVLWGADIAIRQPGDIHPWHVDIETAAPSQRFVSVWIGLENTSEKSSLRLIRRSHDFGVTVQQVQSEHGYKRGEARDATILDWARERDRAAELIVPNMSNGEGLVFDGGLWHGSHNLRKSGARTAILLQYAAASAPVYMADLNHLEWPLRLMDKPRPPVIAIAGRGDETANRLVSAPPPQRSGQTLIPEQVSPIDMPLDEDRIKMWRPYHLFFGQTDSAALMTCHVSVLSPGHCPHPPHAHIEEEILIPLDGEAEITIADGPEGQKAQISSLGPGSLVYYPAFRHHTIRNQNDRPITYLMFKWHGPPAETDGPADPEFHHFGAFASEVHDRPFRPAPVFDHPTNFLSKLHAHLTDLQPGAGYPPHSDDYDVAILVLAGKVETLGQTIGPFGVIFYPANQPHGIHNPGDKPARYLVFEFHRASTASNLVQTTTYQSSGKQPPIGLLRYVNWLRRKLFRQSGT